MKYFLENTHAKLFLLLLVTLFLFVASKQLFSDPKKQHKQKTMTIIEKSTIRETVDNNGFIGIITVTNIERIHPGTRGETALITANVDLQVHNKLQSPVEIARYWNSQQEALQLGRKYVVALQYVARFRPRLWLAGYQELDCDDCSMIVDKYRNIIEQK